MANFISGNGIRPGYVIIYNGKLHRVMKAEHRTPGNKRAFCQAKLRNLETGLQCAVKFRGDENVERAALEQVEMEYLYEGWEYEGATPLNFKQVASWLQTLPGWPRVL